MSDLGLRGKITGHRRRSYLQQGTRVCITCECGRETDWYSTYIEAALAHHQHAEGPI
jgi:hypothetical protein